MFKKFLSIAFVLFLGTQSVFATHTPDRDYEDDVRTNQVIDNPFSDVDINTLHGQAALYLYNQHIISGYEDGTFRGYQPVTRAGAMKFLVNAADISVSDEDRNNGRFSDLLEGEWYVKYVIKAFNEGIVSGNPDGNFYPANNVTQAEFFKMLSGVFDLNDDYPIESDDTWWDAYRPFIQDFGLLGGRRYQAGKAMSRDEVALAIYRILTRGDSSNTYNSDNQYTPVVYISSTANAPYTDVNPLQSGVYDMPFQFHYAVQFVDQDGGIVSPNVYTSEVNIHASHYRDQSEGHYREQRINGVKNSAPRQVRETTTIEYKGQDVNTGAFSDTKNITFISSNDSQGALNWLDDYEEDVEEEVIDELYDILEVLTITDLEDRVIDTLDEYEDLIDDYEDFIVEALQNDSDHFIEDYLDEIHDDVEDALEETIDELEDKNYVDSDFEDEAYNFLDQIQSYLRDIIDETDQVVSEPYDWTHDYERDIEDVVIDNLYALLEEQTSTHTPTLILDTLYGYEDLIYSYSDRIKQSLRVDNDDEAIDFLEDLHDDVQEALEEVLSELQMKAFIDFPFIEHAEDVLDEIEDVFNIIEYNIVIGEPAGIDVQVSRNEVKIGNSTHITAIIVDENGLRVDYDGEVNFITNLGTLVDHYTRARNGITFVELTSLLGGTANIRVLVPELSFADNQGIEEIQVRFVEQDGRPFQVY